MAKDTKPTKATIKPTPELITPVLDGAFEIVGVKATKINTGWGNFDLSNLTEEQAEFLVSKNVTFIRKT